MRISIGNDHRGYELKNSIVDILVEMGFTIFDKGSHDTNSVDYPDIAAAVAHSIPKEADMGILICGSGVGMSIAANKVKGIRAALIRDVEGAKLCRQHNAANVLCLASSTPQEKLEEIVKSFICSDAPSVDRHTSRVNKIKLLEEGKL
jgi:ribose 5-phosphate isomerase B